MKIDGANLLPMPRVSSVRSCFENRMYQHPLCGLGKDLYLLENGWRLVGFATAPYLGAGRHAIIYERLIPDPDNVFEVGKCYWCHGDEAKMKIYSKLPKCLEDEFGPWTR